MFAYLFFKKFPSYSALLGPCLIKEIWPLHIWLSKWKGKIYQKLLWKLNKVLFTRVRCNEFGSHVFQTWILSFVKKYLNHIFQTCAFRNRNNSSQPWFWVAMKPKSWLSWVVSISKGTCLENVIEVLFYNELNPREKKTIIITIYSNNFCIQIYSSGQSLRHQYFEFNLFFNYVLFA